MTFETLQFISINNPLRPSLSVIPWGEIPVGSSLSSEALMSVKVSSKSYRTALIFIPGCLFSGPRQRSCLHLGRDGKGRTFISPDDEALLSKEPFFNRLAVSRQPSQLFQIHDLVELLTFKNLIKQ